MSTITMSSAQQGLVSAPLSGYDDPLDEDTPGDDVVRTTLRGLVRLALVAVETGARFEREGVTHDPMSWMLAPRVLFDGAVALDACLTRQACVRGILLHGLAFGLDADPDVIDALGIDDGYQEPKAKATKPRGDVPPLPRQPVFKLRLFTATIVSRDGGETVHAFHASLAVDASEVARRLYCRIGAASAHARIFVGFDPSDPLVEALVAPAMCDTLALIEADPGSPLAAGLDVNVEQRFSG